MPPAPRPHRRRAAASSRPPRQPRPRPVAPGRRRLAAPALVHRCRSAGSRSPRTTACCGTSSALVPWLFGAADPLWKALYVARAGHAGGDDRLRASSTSSAARGRPWPTPRQPEQIPLPLSKSFPSSHASMAVVGDVHAGRPVPAVDPRARRPDAGALLQPRLPRRALPRRRARRPRLRPGRSAPSGCSSSRRRCDVRALSTRGGQLAVATAAVLVLVIGLAAAGAFDGCRRHGAAKVGPPVRRRVRLAARRRRLRHGQGARRAASASAPPTPGARSTRASSSPARSSSTATSRCTAGVHRDRGRAPRPLRATSSPSRRATPPSASSSAPTTTPSAAGEGYLDNATGVGLLLEVAGARQDACRRRTPSSSSRSAPRSTGLLGSAVLPARA